ncbi:MAG: hypothetical protein ACD_12C00887G0006 [uncultured bacterium]|nr:MAG: hypothetical protein ACD_12C00887G0006 [uncultured bacterium]
MSYRNKTYVIFDGDTDMWAYAYMKGWNKNENVDFDFNDAHDIGGIREDSQEETVKKHLKERFASSSQVIVLIGEHTKNLYKYVRWEIEVAQDLDLPIIAVNLNNFRKYDSERCPSIMKDKYIAHISFKMKIIKYALDNFPDEYNNRGQTTKENCHYNDKIYQDLGLL